MDCMKTTKIVSMIVAETIAVSKLVNEQWNTGHHGVI